MAKVPHSTRQQNTTLNPPSKHQTSEHQTAENQKIRLPRKAFFIVREALVVSCATPRILRVRVPRASIKYASSSLNSFKEQGAGSIPTPDRPDYRCLVSGADVGFPASRLQTALHCRLTTLGVTVGWNPVCSSVRSCPATPIKAFVRRNIHVSD
eukprot:3933092-Rhodomonas_salina.2